ncbi:hypothetical protein [Thalassolituus oleivorans]|uniref:hypothetical protein n=1 Tax=Thalassolituus oleivorans TaxID=187493 RepID=UPI00042DC67B|nr:hypothetical protein [Thalassolituus oleivorans]AHK17275.1 hypothetical protein R615_02755 [Thalassolituus oleivorans R6-15]
MTLRILISLLFGAMLSACGGVDEGIPPITSGGTTASCIQDTWSRNIPGIGGGSVELTYEFLEDGTYIQRSYVDNISTADYISGSPNTNLDIDVLPGLSIDLGAMLNILGPFYSEGYFYTQGTWVLEESSGIITSTLPKNEFGHSIWSASSAKRDFDRNNPTPSQVASNTIDQYAYCKGDRLVVGAFYKEDDSNIAGLWDNLNSEFYVAEDYVGATQRFRSEDGEVYAKKPFAMTLLSDGYALRQCAQEGEMRGGNNASFYKVTSDNKITPTGGLLPPKVDVYTDYYEMLSDAYYYRLDSGLLSRVDINSGDVTELLELDKDTKVRTKARITGGIVVSTYKVGDSNDTLLLISDNSNDVLQVTLERGVFSGPWSDGELVLLANNDTGLIHKVDLMTGSLTAIPFEGAPAIDASMTSVSLVNEQLIVSSKSGDLHQFWTYSQSTQALELLASVSDTGSGYASIIAGDGGFDVFIKSGYRNESLGRIVHLSEADGYAATSDVSLNFIKFEPKGAATSKYFIFNSNGAGSYQLSLLDVVTQEISVISPSGVQVSNSFTTNSDGSRVIYMIGGLVTSEAGQVVVIDIAENGTVSHQIIDAGRSGQYASAHSGDVSAFYVQDYSDEGDSRSRLFAATGTGADMTLVTDEYTFGSSSSANGDDFIVNEQHLLAPAGDEYSAHELMLYNKSSQEFDFWDLNKVPDVSSSPRLLGTIGGETLISAWNLENSCYEPEGLLKFEGHYLWYENNYQGFAGVQWFTRN